MRRSLTPMTFKKMLYGELEGKVPLSNVSVTNLGTKILCQIVLPKGGLLHVEEGTVYHGPNGVTHMARKIINVWKTNIEG